MDGSIGADLAEQEGLVILVRDELLSLRGEYGELSPQKFASYPTLLRVCGGGDLLDAFFMFERELRRYRAGSRNEAAAAISISATADTVLDRLEHAVGALPQDGRLRDQRTARRWSDDGIETIAADLVYLAQVQGRLGTELLGIEIRGNEREGLHLSIDQMTTAGLTVRAPLIRLWQYIDDEPVQRDLTVDLDDVPPTVATQDSYAMRRHHLTVEMPDASATAKGTILLGISIEGRDAPMRTVTIEDHSTLTDDYLLRYSIYRTIASIEIIARP